MTHAQPLIRRIIRILYQLPPGALRRVLACVERELRRQQTTF